MASIFKFWAGIFGFRAGFKKAPAHFFKKNKCAGKFFNPARKISWRGRCEQPSVADT